MVRLTLIETVNQYLWENLGISHILCAAALILSLKAFLKSPRNLPPGPWSLPIVGYLPFITNFPPLRFGKMAAKYGGIFSLYFGSTLVVMLNDFEVIKETLVKHAELFSGRQSIESFQRILNRKHNGLLAGDGPNLRENRRHFLSTFRDFGMGKSSLEPKILDEISSFKAQLLETKSAPTDFSSLLSQSVSNVICLLCFGKRFNYYDKVTISFTEALKTVSVLSNNTAMSRWMLWLTELPLMRKLFGQDRLRLGLAEIQRLVDKEIEEHKKEHVEDENSDYVHAYLNEIASNRNPSSFNMQYLSNNGRQLFIAGTETTASTLMWIILYMVMYPEVQRKVQKEIDEEYGERTPSYSDKAQTPFSEAVIMEVSRLASTVPLSVTRTNFEAITIRGYYIPKRTIILTNIWNVHRNPEHFPDPSAFKPERFIGEDGKFRNIEQFIPFGIGKRSCVGEGLARMELYLYFTSLLQSFTFEKEENEILTNEPIYGLTDCPRPFRVSAIPRNK